MEKLKELLYELSSCNNALKVIEDGLEDSYYADSIRQLRIRESSLLDQIDRIIHKNFV